MSERQPLRSYNVRLRQTRSITLYITEFQTITSNLDWDDEALEDKFLEGLKQEVRQALIYYPTDAKDLDDLFERTQRIDNEQRKNRDSSKFQRNPFTGAGRSFYGRGPTLKKDAEGDVVMKGAKVDLEKAKRDRLCFHCGKPGHQARFCRVRKREADKKGPNIRMLRAGRTPIVNPMSESSGNLDDDAPASELYKTAPSNDMDTSDEENKPDELEEPTDEKHISEELEKR